MSDMSSDDDLNFEVLQNVAEFGDTSSLMAIDCGCSTSSTCTCTSTSTSCIYESSVQ